MIPREIINKVRRIQITTSRKVSDVFAGQYQSVFKGAGMEFDEVREYMPGDEIRSIDWNVTARMGAPYIKKFVEERELTIILLLDISTSCRYGTVNMSKSELAAEFCSVIAFSAITNNDKVGMITFTDEIESFIPPRKGLRHVLRVIREALYNDPAGTGTDLNKALDYLNNVLTRRSIIFVVSDFFAPDFRKTLRITNKRHDVIGVTISDPSEKDIPDAGIVRFRDAETGDPFIMDTSRKSLREKYSDKANTHMNNLKDIFGAAKVDNINLMTNVSYVQPLVRFFRMRERRLAKKR